MTRQVIPGSNTADVHLFMGVTIVSLPLAITLHSSDPQLRHPRPTVGQHTLLRQPHTPADCVTPAPMASDRNGV